MTSSMTRTPAPGVTGSDPAVSLVGVPKDFGRVHVVRGIDLDIRPGEVVAFLGPTAPARPRRST